MAASSDLTSDTNLNTPSKDENTDKAPVDLEQKDSSSVDENQAVENKPMDAGNAAVGPAENASMDKDDGYQSEMGEDKADPPTNDDDKTDPLINEAEQEVIDDVDDVDIGDTTNLDSDGRNKLFNRGLTFDRLNRKNSALKCYMGCLNGLKQNSNFPLLPQCLRNIADIFYQKSEFDKAVHFIQAEKVYYESALIDTDEIQRRLEEAQKTEDEGEAIPAQHTDTVRADEYEHLARLCLDRKQPQLALEYAGKATKLRQQLLGDGHLITQQSLDFFASVYAEVGAKQYKDSMDKFTNPDPERNNNENGSPNSSNEPVSILRKRKSEVEKRVRFDDVPGGHVVEQKTQDEKLAKTVLWALLIMCCVLLLVLGVYLYCILNQQDGACYSLRSNVYYAYMRVKYYYYHYMSSSKGNVYT